MSDLDGLNAKARLFIEKVYQELALPGVEDRIAEVYEEIRVTGTYVHTSTELEHGARMAWRNSNRCIGRLFWKSLMVQDKRSLSASNEVFEALVDHIQMSTNEGKILPMITIFQPKSLLKPDHIRIWNHQLIGYAGYVAADGRVTGDPKNIALTNACLKYGWKGGDGQNDLLPLLIQAAGKDPVVYELPEKLILQVPIRHPDFPQVEQLALKWYAVPIISDMVLEIGGILYPAAPFNGWYMVTEIGSRNFADQDRYNVLPVLADALNMDRSKRNPFWKDKVLVILNEAVQYAYKQAGVRIVDHHTASEQFMKFVRNEQNEGRAVHGDWSWIVPPLSGSSTDVFHYDMDNQVLSPNFFYNHSPVEEKKAVRKCPFHISAVH